MMMMMTILLLVNKLQENHVFGLQDPLDCFCPIGEGATRRVLTMYYIVDMLSIMHIGLFEEILLSSTQQY